MTCGKQEAAAPGRKFRTATRNSKAPKGFAGLVLALLALSVVGCGRQDRYEITGLPGTPAAPPADIVRFTQIPAPTTSSSDLRALAAWSADDCLLSLGYGQVYRLQDGLYRHLPWPRTAHVVGLVIARDGQVWGLDIGGRVCRLVGDAWELSADILDGDFFLGLMEDDQGRLVAYGKSGQVMRLEPQGWVQRFADPEHDFYDGWAAPGQGACLVTYRGAVFRLTDAGTQLMTLLPDMSGDQIRIEGDGQGALVVSSPYDGVWLRTGEIWTDISPETAFLETFWSSGRLLGLAYSPRGIYSWNGATWDPWAELPDDTYVNTPLSVPLAEGRLISLRYGSLLNLVGQEANLLTPPLGAARGVVRYQGSIHLLLSEGAHLVAVEGGWRVVGTPLAGVNVLSGNPLGVDQDGRLLMAGNRRLVWWDGHAYETADHSVLSWNNALPQPDGSLCVSGSRDWGVVRRGRYAAFPALPDSWDHLVGAVLDEEGTGRVVDSGRLGRASGGTVDIELLMQSWRAYGMTSDAEGRLVVHGGGRVVRQDGPGWEDITPRLVWQVSVRTMMADGLGGLLGWDSSNDALLRLDQNGWTYQAAGGLDINWGSVTLVPDQDGTFLMTGPRNGILQLERVVWP